MATLALAFVAGLLTILSPCVLPLAPIVVAGARARDPRGPLLLALGLALTFGIVGGSLASIGIEFGDAKAVRVVSAGIMVAVGLAALLPVLGDRAERLLLPVSGWGEALSHRLPTVGLLGQAAAGVILAFAWAPCVGPTLGAAFTLAASGGSRVAAMATMTTFAFGSAVSLLAAGYGLGRLAASGRLAAGRASVVGRVLLGAVFVMVGVAILSGLDHAIEGVLTQAMPDWLVTVATKL